MARGEDAAAEAFLREISDPADADPALFVSLVKFLEEMRGREVASAMVRTPSPTAQ